MNNINQKTFYMKTQLNYLLGTLFCLFLLSSCASLTGFEEGRVLGEDVSEFGVSVNYVQTPDLFDSEEFEGPDSLNSTIGFPNIEFNYKRGINDKMDVGGRLSTNLAASTYLKYQVVGDRSSKFALSPGLEFGTVLGAAYSVGIPVYASIYPTEGIAINLNPRFIYQFVTGAESDGAAYLGGNLGLMFGKKNKFGLDFGYYKVTTDGTTNNLLTFGIGGRFRFGDGVGSSSGSSKRRKR